MNSILISWVVSFVVLVVLAVALGHFVIPAPGWMGVLIDGRGRFSLTHFQLVLWSVLLLSLISGVFWGRLIDGVDDPLSFSIPDEVLGLLGITTGSAVAAAAVKSAKDARTDSAVRIAASSPADPPRFPQIFLLEEGEYADKVIDVTKFQNFVFTLVLLVAYAVLAVHAIRDASASEPLSGLPKRRS